MTKAKTYWTLACRDDGKWSAQYGSYDRQDAMDEMEDYLDHDYKRSDCMIVQSGDAQADIDAVIAALNAGQ